MSSRQKIAILNSRQGLYPCRSDLWIQKTLEALQTLKNSQPLILASVGMSTWDIVTIISSRLQLHLELYIQKVDSISEEQAIENIISDYKLDNEKVNLNFITENSNNFFQQERDLSIISSADLIYPISIRQKGNLENLLIENEQKIECSFKIKYQKRENKIAYTLEDSNLTDKIQNISENYLTHWTKTSKNKWCHEQQADYYNAIINSDSYPRTAFNTLQNIIKTQTIFSTSTHMPQKIPTVSFTSISPIEMIPLFKWRSRYSEMSFEPYGIGIKKELTTKLNIQKVLYYDKDNSENNSFKNSDRWLTQSKGQISNWESENEYRHLGDFRLDKLNKNDIILYTRFKKEADQLQKLTGIKTISFLP